ncbi:MAG: hypothetical protein M3168_02315 [Actinomycetota bacterium]|nr:hypothetical protein [Actinomycetota bacterium]
MTEDRPIDIVGGLLAAASLVVSAIAIVQTPVRLAPAAILVALVAAGIGGRHRGLANFAVAAAGVAWLVGMTIAIAAENPLY